MLYYHADVFSCMALAGNGLTVVFDEDNLSKNIEQRLAQELKQFETIYISKAGPGQYRAAIFTVEEELDFAGHPVLGAAAVIHEELYKDNIEADISFILNTKTVETKSRRNGDYFVVEMNQDPAEFLGTVSDELKADILKAIGLSEAEAHIKYPMEIVSTGLPYLIIPLSSGIERAGIKIEGFEYLLKNIGAKFVYILDVNRLEGRTWDNLGKVEDAATGSAAGPAGAYLYKHNVISRGSDIIINQGRYIGRPSKIRVRQSGENGDILVSGEVVLLAKGEISNKALLALNQQ